MDKLILGNWKMNKTNQEIEKFCLAFNDLISHDQILKRTKTVIGIAPTFVGLNSFKTLNKTSALTMAQNVNAQLNGAYTSEVSYDMLKEIGVNHVLIGHSEVRSNLKEDDKKLNQKVLTLLQNGMSPILCVGETLKEFEDKQTLVVLQKQLECDLANIDLSQIHQLIIAYEPIWAIGTGKTATNEIIANTFVGLKKILQPILKDKLSQVAILYGGSANEKNAQDILNIENVDGVLVGGASLDPQKFYKIIQSTPEYIKNTVK